MVLKYIISIKFRIAWNQTDIISIDIYIYIIYLYPGFSGCYVISENLFYLIFLSIKKYS